MKVLLERRSGLYLIPAFLLFCSIVGGLIWAGYVGSFGKISPEIEGLETGKSQELDQQVIATGLWQPGNDFPILRFSISKKSDNGQDLQEFHIDSLDGRRVYQLTADVFGDVLPLQLLATRKKQLVLTGINSGGSARQLQILDYQGGHIVNLINEDDSFYSGGIMTNQIMLDNPRSMTSNATIYILDTVTSKRATVLQFSNGKYRKSGQTDSETIIH